MTDIAKLGEFGLIHHLTDGFKPKNESTKYGVGDDCAVMHYPDKEVLVTTDMLMEGVHFDLTYIDMQHLGYKSAMVNISDIFAMNGTPRQLIVSIALSKRFTVEDMEMFYSGLRMACDKWNVDIVGGDTTSSYTGLAISITCIGECERENIVYRNGAKDTDLICVSGDLGAAYMGLQLLEREKSVYYQQVNEAKKKNDKRANETDARELKSALEAYGWIVQLKSLGQRTIMYWEHYKLWKRLLAENERSVPKLRIDANECPNLVSAMYCCKKVPGSTPIELDKTPERKVRIDMQAGLTPQIPSALTYLVWGKYARFFPGISENYNAGSGFVNFSG